MNADVSDKLHAENPIADDRRAEILQDLIEITSKAAKAQIGDLTTHLADALVRAAASCASAQEAGLRVKAANLLKKNRYPFYYIVTERLANMLRQEVQLLQQPSLAPSDTGTPLKPLPPEVEVDRKICLMKAGRMLENDHAERLAALNIRLAYLMGRHELPTAQNPFRPHVFLSLIHDAWCEFQPDAGSHHLIFPLLTPGLCLDMAPILHALNAALIKRGIVAQLAESFSAPGVSSEHAPAQDEADASPLVRQLRRLFPAEEKAAAKSGGSSPSNGFPALFTDEAVQATAARNELLSYLEGLQKTLFDRHLAACAGSGPQAAPMLNHIKRHAPPGALTQVNESTIDLVARIFDAVFHDKNMPDEIKTAIGSLQVPVLKAALLDKDFFFKEQHPARRVIELLVKLAVGMDPRKGQSDPLHPIIQRSIKRIQQDSEQCAAVFVDAMLDLEAFIKRDETASDQMLAAQIAKALQQEKTREAAKAAKHEIALRIGTGEVVAFVETFLEDKWVTVLTLAYGMKDEKPQMLESAVKTMDDLCWSVKPKITPAERKEFLTRLPGIVAMLNKWLDTIKWNDAERKRFFAELAECHASIVRAPVELSPERQMQLALAASKKAAERRLQRQASQQPEPEPDKCDERVRSLERGSWLEFARQDGSVAKAKLAWVSPMRNFYIFSTSGRQEALSLAAEDLAQVLRDKRARIVATTGLIDRALAEALGVEYASNDAVTAKSAA